MTAAELSTPGLGTERSRARESVTSTMQRRLAAILFTDVVSYGRMVEADPIGTLERLKANRRTIFDPQVSAFGGRVCKLLGDGAIVEFSSVVAAVNCALAIQEVTETAAQAIPNSMRIRYRIGVHLCEIIVDEDEVYGEGINVAALLEGLAPVGRVALSKIVRDNVERKLRCTFEDIGEHTIRNTTVHAFLVGVPPNTPSA